MFVMRDEAKDGSKARRPLSRSRKRRRRHLARIVGDGEHRVGRSKIDTEIHGGTPHDAREFNEEDGPSF